MPRRKKDAAEAAAAGAAPEPKKRKRRRRNKLQAVQDALTELGADARPLEIQKHLLEKRRLKMTTKHISTYTGMLARRAAGTSGIVRTEPKRESTKALGGSVTIRDIQAVKALADRLGAETVWELVTVLGR